MSFIMGYNYFLGLKKIYINLICSIFTYVYIYNKSRVMDTRVNEPRYVLRPLEGYT
jgi:hypothetical protein